MSVDTENKRRSISGYSGLIIYPRPDGSLANPADRDACIGLYAGLAPGGPAIVVARGTNMTVRPLKFRRKLGEQLTFAVTVYDRLGVRQSMAGISDLACNITKPDGSPVVTGDRGNCAINEAGPSTAGDISYSRAPDGTTTFQVGTYRAEFQATIGGVIVKFPEDSYIILSFS